MKAKPAPGVLIPLALLVIATVLIRVMDTDLLVARYFYASDGSWPLEFNPLLSSIFNLGILPAIFVGIAALIILLAGIGNASVARYRKISAYLLIYLIAGCGILTNFLLKDLWGRPRPCQLAEFGGLFEFEPIAWMDLASSGRSFPCGHATMGFYFFAVALAMPTSWKRRRAAVFSFALLLGATLGFARIAQGGHFLSDVIWAAGLMWFFAVGLFHLMHLGENRMHNPSRQYKDVPSWLTYSALPIIIAALSWVTFGTSYSGENEINTGGALPAIIRLAVEGEVVVEKGKTLRIVTTSHGYGLPRSKLKFRSECEANTLTVLSSRRGYFTKINSTVTITLPEDKAILIERITTPPAKATSSETILTSAG
ncbi:phosphatase PAP2 family protein [Luteolibacter sp. AS25]|uniref:phosphatase PAP2 family protein n=1 Tax=Luteolibacter sp. AS25 TaxID=3135776 RepID=UPI00398B9043